jgi:outer membrane protein OmpA-like peptidoglycan-associated protein
VSAKGDSKTRMNWDDIPAVYFDFDRIDLDDNSLITISKIAAKMKADPNLYVEVRGYCDYMGNNPYNNLLSQRRSDRVKKELVNIWGIPFDHIISNGKGKALEPKIKYRPNRRCDFFFGKL